VKTAVISHLEAQERQLRGFLAQHASDARAFEASLRLVRLLGLRGAMRNDNKAYVEATRLLDRLEKSVTSRTTSGSRFRAPFPGNAPAR
jgi:hypothetical protein